jgi:hypothetical protein
MFQLVGSAYCAGPVSREVRWESSREKYFELLLLDLELSGAVDFRQK